MSRILPTALATALMSVSALAFAQPADSPSTGQTPSAAAPATPPAGQMSPPPAAAPAPAPAPAAPATPAPAADSAAPAAPASDASSAPPPKPKMHHHKKAHKQVGREVEETEALNKLQAGGYSDIKDLHAENGGYKATATKDGKEQPVEISKTGEIQGSSGGDMAMPSSGSPAPAPTAPPMNGGGNGAAPSPTGGPPPGGDTGAPPPAPPAQ